MFEKLKRLTLTKVTLPNRYPRSSLGLDPRRTWSCAKTQDYCSYYAVWTTRHHHWPQRCITSNSSKIFAAFYGKENEKMDTPTRPIPSMLVTSPTVQKKRIFALWATARIEHHIWIFRRIRRKIQISLRLRRRDPVRGREGPSARLLGQRKFLHMKLEANPEHALVENINLLYQKKQLNIVSLFSLRAWGWWLLQVIRAVLDILHQFLLLHLYSVPVTLFLCGGGGGDWRHWCDGWLQQLAAPLLLGYRPQWTRLVSC